MPNQISKKNSRLKKRRAVADIISTMLLMGVTISGATTLTYFVNDGFAQTRDEATSGTEEFIKTYPELRSPELAKIHSQIIEWKSSSNPEAFARDNNLIFSDNKIQVYVYLDSAESISNVPQDIDVVDSDENIVVAFASSEQINQLAQLDFVVQISPPIRAIIPPIPISQEGDEIDNSALIGIGIMIIVAIIVGMLYSKKRKASRTQ